MTGIDFGIIKQGSQPRVTFIWPLPDTHEPSDFTGMTITATMYDTKTTLVTAVTGALTVIDGATREIEWAMTDTDTGTDGRFWITFMASGVTEEIYSLYGKLDIENNPAINASSNPPLVGIPVEDAGWLAAARPLNDPPQTWAALADVPGIGFDTLSNVLVVDQGFDSDTPGWGVTAFATVGSAYAAANDSDTLFLNGVIQETTTITITNTITLVGLSASVIGATAQTVFEVTTGTLKVIGDISVQGLSAPAITVDGFGQLSVINANVISQISLLSGGILINLDGIHDLTLLTIDTIPIGHMQIAASNIGTIDGSATYQVFSDYCNISILEANFTIDPLNASNTVNGATYREVVALATLPAAADHPGAMAATSDGGTGGIPALMYSDGVTWVVAAPSSIPDPDFVATSENDTITPEIVLAAGAPPPRWTITEADGTQYFYNVDSFTHNRTAPGNMEIRLAAPVLPYLTTLDMNGDGLIGTCDVTNLTALTNLRLYNNALTDIGVVTNLTALTYLHLGDNALTDIGDVTNLTALTNLYLYINALTDIGVVTNLTALTNLHLGGNQLTDIGVVTNLTALTNLYLYGNQLTDIGVVTNLTALTNLYLYGNAVQTAQIDALVSSMYDGRFGYTHATPDAQLGGTNEAPSGIYQDATPPTDGKEFIFKLVENPDLEPINAWTISYTA